MISLTNHYSQWGRTVRSLWFTHILYIYYIPLWKWQQILNKFSSQFSHRLMYIYIYPHHGSLINRDLFMVDIPMCTYVSWLHPVFFHGFAWVKSYFSHDFPWLHHVTSSLPKQVDASPLRPNSTGPFSQWVQHGAAAVSPGAFLAPLAPSKSVGTWRIHQGTRKYHLVLWHSHGKSQVLIGKPR